MRTYYILKINNDIEDFNNTISQFNLNYIYRIYYPKQQHTFHTCTHGTLMKTDHITGNKTSLNKLEIIGTSNVCSLSITEK